MSLGMFRFSTSILGQLMVLDCLARRHSLLPFLLWVFAAYSLGLSGQYVAGGTLVSKRRVTRAQFRGTGLCQIGHRIRV